MTPSPCCGCWPRPSSRPPARDPAWCDDMQVHSAAALSRAAPRLAAALSSDAATVRLPGRRPARAHLPRVPRRPERRAGGGARWLPVRRRVALHPAARPARPRASGGVLEIGVAAAGAGRRRGSADLPRGAGATHRRAAGDGDGAHRGLAGRSAPRRRDRPRQRGRRDGHRRRRPVCRRLPLPRVVLGAAGATRGRSSAVRPCSST